MTLLFFLRELKTLMDFDLYYNRLIKLIIVKGNQYFSVWFYVRPKQL